VLVIEVALFYGMQIELNSVTGQIHDKNNAVKKMK
jgi:hypothetical protein